MQRIVGTVQSAWGPRAETPDELAERLAFFLDEIAAFAEFAGVPLAVAGDDPEPEPLDPSRLRELIAASPRRDDSGRPWEGRGWGLSLVAASEQGGVLAISFGGGASNPVKRVAFNSCTLDVREGFPLDAFRAFAETNLLAMADAFDAHFGWAFEPPHLRVNPRGALRPRLGPVSYVADELAVVPDPLPGASLERHHDGTLIRVAPARGEHLWEDPEPVARVVAQLEAAGWAPSLAQLNPPA